MIEVFAYGENGIVAHISSLATPVEKELSIAYKNFVLAEGFKTMSINASDPWHTSAE